MKKLFLFAAVMFSSILFSACSEDDNKENQTSQKLLKQIEKIFRNGTCYYNFSYDDSGRLAKVTINGDHDFCGDYPYTYTDNSVSVKYNDHGYDPWNYDAAFILDHNGYVTEFDINGETRWRYEYENGYVSSKSSNRDRDIVTYRWENGNLMECRQVVENLHDTYTHTYTYTYTDKPNKLNINLFDAQFGLGNFGIFAYVVFLPTNFKGSIPSNYPASADNSNIYYEYDDEGYPTQIVGPNANYILTYY
mgnify:CR=1 FL=1